MEPEPRYVFYFNNPDCVKRFDTIYGPEDGELQANIISDGMRRGKSWGCGDMLAFRDDLIDGGFKFGEDFYVRKTAKL